MNDASVKFTGFVEGEFNSIKSYSDDGSEANRRMEWHWCMFHAYSEERVYGNAKLFVRF